MKKILFLFITFPLIIFGQTKLTKENISRSPSTINHPSSYTNSKAPGDILYSFDFTDGVPDGWTIIDDGGIGAWEFYQDSARSAQYTNPELAMINSPSGGGYMHMPVEYYNTIPDSWPPQDNNVYIEGNSTLMTNWMNVSGISEVVLTYAAWYRHWHGEFEILVYIDGDNTEPAAILNGLNINGEVTPTNYFPGPSDGNNACFPRYNLKDVVGYSFSSVKLAFKVSATSHYFWSIDDIQLVEAQNNVRIIETYAVANDIYTISPSFEDTNTKKYTKLNTNYSAVPTNIIYRPVLGAYLKQEEGEGINTRVQFAIDSAYIQDFWIGYSTTTIPYFGNVPTEDSIMHTDVFGGIGDIVPEFYNPDLNLNWFDVNYYDYSIPYIFKYRAITDNEDYNTDDNLQFYEFNQTLGRYSYHWQPKSSNGVNISSFYSPFTDTLPKNNDDMFFCNYDCFQDVNISDENRFKIIGLRFFLADNEYTTFNAIGNGVELTPILFYYDTISSSWEQFVDAQAESVILDEAMKGKWVFLDFRNEIGQIDNANFSNTSYRIGIIVNNYHNQKFSIGMDTKYHQASSHCISWRNNDWVEINNEGSLMIDMYTNIEQLYYDMVNIPIKVKTNLRIFPNPNNGRFMVRFEKQVVGTITVIDISGKTILSDKIQKQDKWINDRTLESGIYLVKINIENEGVQIVKMIVE